MLVCGVQCSHEFSANLRMEISIHNELVDQWMHCYVFRIFVVVFFSVCLSCHEFFFGITLRFTILLSLFPLSFTLPVAKSKRENVRAVPIYVYVYFRVQCLLFDFMCVPFYLRFVNITSVATHNGKQTHWSVFFGTLNT